MAERGAGLLLDLHHENVPTAPEYEVELVAPDASIGVEEPVAAEPVVAKGDSLAPVHATSW
jgi:hypothetical protein